MDESAADREGLSALVDGELDASASAAACATWRGSEAFRRDWHDWQLIGDVLRSDDLASAADHDLRFLARVRERLASEPVVFAPAAARAAARVSAPARPSPWVLSSAVAAGFLVVVGAVAVLQPGGPTAPVPGPLARVDSVPAAAPATPAVTPMAPAEPQVAVVADGKLIRDARLDRYLAAHKQFAGSSALGVPSAFLRSATVDTARTAR